MIPQSAAIQPERLLAQQSQSDCVGRQFNERLVREDKLNDRYSDQLNKINWFILITPENFIKLIYVWEDKTRALLIDWEENVWEILNALVKRYGVPIQENA